MSKLRTEESIIDRIQSNYIWRIHELSILRNSIPNSESAKQKVLIRAGIALLYANWEGFIKESCDDYYEFVSKKGYNYNELSSAFVAVSLKNKINEFETTKKITLQKKLIEELMNEFTKRAVFSSDTPIKTSNLKFEIFEDICTLIGLDINNYILKETFINEILVANRNKIAHGKFLLIDYDSFIDIYNTCIGLLNQIKNEMINSIINKKYLKICC